MYKSEFYKFSEVLDNPDYASVAVLIKAIYSTATRIIPDEETLRSPEAAQIAIKNINRCINSINAAIKTVDTRIVARAVDAFIASLGKTDDEVEGIGEIQTRGVVLWENFGSAYDRALREGSGAALALVRPTLELMAFLEDMQAISKDFEDGEGWSTTIEIEGIETARELSEWLVAAEGMLWSIGLLFKPHFERVEFTSIESGSPVKAKWSVFGGAATVAIIESFERLLWYILRRNTVEGRINEILSLKERMNSVGIDTSSVDPMLVDALEVECQKLKILSERKSRAVKVSGRVVPTSVDQYYSQLPSTVADRKALGDPGSE